MSDERVEMALLREKVATVMQVAEGFKFIAERVEESHHRIDRLHDRAELNDRGISELRGYISAVERRREDAAATMRDELLRAIADVKADVAESGDRAEKHVALVRTEVRDLKTQVGTATAARITARGAIVATCLTGVAGLLALVIARALGGAG